jgi:hypothetical protein
MLNGMSLSPRRLNTFFYGVASTVLRSSSSTLTETDCSKSARSGNLVCEGIDVFGYAELLR